MLSAARFRRTQHSSESSTHFMFGPRQCGNNDLSFLKHFFALALLRCLSVNDCSVEKNWPDAHERDTRKHICKFTSTVNK